MRTIKNTTTNKLEIKNSKFITVLLKIDDNTDINNILSNIKQKYPNINVINIKSDRPLEEVQKEIREKIGY